MQENQFASMPKLPPARQSQFLATAEKLIPNQPFWVAETSKILSEAKDLTLRLAYVWWRSARGLDFEKNTPSRTI
jgi:hypothetical protein